MNLSKESSTELWYVYVDICEVVADESSNCLSEWIHDVEVVLVE
jgi:hypothetical protein